LSFTHYRELGPGSEVPPIQAVPVFGPYWQIDAERSGLVFADRDRPEIREQAGNKCGAVVNRAHHLVKDRLAIGPEVGC
jgi:hypothetical protein